MTDAQLKEKDERPNLLKRPQSKEDKNKLNALTASNRGYSSDNSQQQVGSSSLKESVVKKNSVPDQMSNPNTR